jgi:hypothetical protein
MLRENPRFKHVPKKFLNGMVHPDFRFVTGTRERQALTLLNAHLVGRRFFKTERDASRNRGDQLLEAGVLIAS